jgi:hypothetical protein
VESKDESRNDYDTRDGHKYTSKYRGVSWNKSSSKWQADIRHTGKSHHLGWFDDEQDAARAYDRAARAHHGGKATLNFLAEGEQGMGVGVISKYRGVSWRKSSSNWRAYIYLHSKQHYLGCFDDEKDAAMAYDRAAREHHGDKAMLNFYRVTPDFVAEGVDEQRVQELAVTAPIRTHSWSGMYPSVITALGFRLQVDMPRGTEVRAEVEKKSAAEDGLSQQQEQQQQQQQQQPQQQQQQPQQPQQMPGVLMRLPKAPCPKRVWSEDEDKALCDAVRTFGPRKWKRIAENVPGRNHIQCIQRWKISLDPGVRKGQWTKEEDSILRGAKQSDPTRSWTQVATFVAGRYGKQCRERWYTILDPCIKVSPNTCSCKCAYACENASGRTSDKARTISYSHLRSTRVFHLLLATRAPTHVPVYDIRPPANCVDWGGGCHAAEDVGTVR